MNLWYNWFLSLFPVKHFGDDIQSFVIDASFDAAKEVSEVQMSGS